MAKTFNITSPDDLNKYHIVQGDTINYTCVSCGKSCTIKRYDTRDKPRYARMMCRHCGILNTRNSPNINVMVHINNPKEFDNIKSRQPFEYSCVRCGKIYRSVSKYKPMYKSYFKQMLCGQCRRDLKRKEITGCYTTKEVQKTKSTPIFVRSYDEMRNIKNRQAFYYICSDCGDRVDVKYNEWRPSYLNMQKYKLMICGKCSSKRSEHNGFGSEKYKLTFMARYNVDNPMRDNQFKENNFRAKEINHGDRYYNNPKKGLETFKKNHDGMTPSEYQQTDDYKHERIEINKKLYGRDWFFQSEEFRLKLVDNLINELNNSSNDIRTKCRMCMNWLKLSDIKKATLSQLYSIRRSCFPLETATRCKFIFDGENFDSYPELAFYIYCKDFWIPISRNTNISYEYQDMYGNKHLYFPDFIVNGNIIEIKGAHFFKSDGTMYCPYRKLDWSDERYNYECDTVERKHKCGIEKGVIFITDLSPYIQGCMNYVFNKYGGKQFMKRFNTNMPNNVSKGYTPFNINKSTNYQLSIGRALTPFDI